MQHEFDIDPQTAWDDDGIAEIEIAEVDLREDLISGLFSCCPCLPCYSSD